MKTVKEISALSGVSVRTLHYYDEIGLLAPSALSEAGYRLYDDAALRRLERILLYRELRFSLKEIRAILDSPDYDAAEALAQQIRLLELERERLDRIIAFARDIQQKGGEEMNFQAFNREAIDQYKAEVQARWGDTEAYQEFVQRNHHTDNQQNAQEMQALFAEFGALRQESPAAPQVQEKVAALKQWISDHYYTCTTNILRSLDEMYTADARFRQNIDNAGGLGTADFVAQAIAVYAQK